MAVKKRQQFIIVHEYPIPSYRYTSYPFAVTESCLFTIENAPLQCQFAMKSLIVKFTPNV